MEMTDIDPEIEAMVENAMEYLRRFLHPLREADLKRYERCYEEYRSSAYVGDRYANAYRILRGCIAELSPDYLDVFAGLVREIKLLSIHVDYIYDVERDVVIRRTPGSETVIGKSLLAAVSVYKCVAEDVQSMAQHIWNRVFWLGKITGLFLHVLRERELATRYPEAIEQEKPREEKSGDEEVG